MKEVMLSVSGTMGSFKVLIQIRLKDLELMVIV